MVLGLVECLKLPADKLMGYFMEGLLAESNEDASSAKATLARSRSRSASTVSELLVQLESHERVLELLVQRLSPLAALALADQLARNIFLSQTMSADPRRRYLCAAEVADWWCMHQRSLAYLEPSDPRSMARRVQDLWPHLTTARNAAAVAAMAKDQPKQLAVILSGFLNEEIYEPWHPGPVRAGQFLNSLNDPEPIRKLLIRQGYPVPRLGVNLGVLALARQQWAAALGHERCISG